MSLYTMPDALRLTLKAELDGTGELFAEVQSNGFVGASSAWFGNQHLIEFAQELAAAYPLQGNSPLRLEGGFWSKSGAVIEQLHVGLKFYPIDSVGRVGCRVSLNTPIHEQDRRESQASVTIELLTTYEQLNAFARALEMLAQGTSNEAVLEAGS